MTSTGADLLANDILASLIAGVSFTIPDVDLSDPLYAVPEAVVVTPPAQINNEALTTQVVGGTGTFDILMSSLKAHLRDEYEQNRISGNEYVKAYIALTEAALSAGTQFLLQRDQAYYQAIAAQLAAQQANVALVTARVQLATTKAQLKAMIYEAKTQEATYALTKMKLATEDVTFGTAKYALDNIAPEQLKMVKEQAEGQRAQTMDTRMDGVTPIAGILGKQRDLYTQQITSYQRDSEVKAAKLFTDAWITQKTMDEGLLAPTSFTNASLEEILLALKTNNNLT